MAKGLMPSGMENRVVPQTHTDVSGNPDACMLKVKYLINSELSNSWLRRNVVRSGVTSQKTVISIVFPVKTIRTGF